MNDKLEIKNENEFTSSSLLELLHLHKTHCEAETPIESCHRLDIDGLRATDVTFWVAWLQDKAVGMIGLKDLGEAHGEVKSMHVLKAMRGEGLADRLFSIMKDEADKRGYQRLSLETGNSDNFQPATRFYQKYGFLPCAPFADYREDPNSLFMTLTLDNARA